MSVSKPTYEKLQERLFNAIDKAETLKEKIKNSGPYRTPNQLRIWRKSLYGLNTIIRKTKDKIIEIYPPTGLS